jgi:hypothetical protein
MVAWTIAAVGWKPLAAVILLSVGAWQWGRLATSRLGDSQAGPLRIELGLLVGFGLLSFFQGLLAHFPINSTWSALGLALVPFIVRPKAILDLRSESGRLFAIVTTPSRPQQFAIALLVFPLAAHWLASLKPEVSSDALTMHLATPSIVANAGYWSFDFHQFLWALMPMGGDWAFTLAYLLGSEAAARLMNLVFLILIACILFTLTRRWLTAPEAGIITGLFLSTPLAHVVTGSLFVENFWTAMTLGAFAGVWLFYEESRPADLWIAGALLGFAASAKLGAVAFAIPLLAAACLLGLTRLRGKLFSKLLPMALAFVVFASTPYLVSYIKTGNPIFPFQSDRFVSAFHVPPLLVRDLRFERPLTWRTLYDLTFHSDRFVEAQPGTAGFQYLLLAPFALVGCLCLKRRWDCFAIVCAAASFALVFAVQSNLRYTYAVMPLASIALAPVIAWCRTEYTWLHRTVIGACLATLMLNVYFLAASGYIHRDFWMNPFNANESRNYIERFAPPRLLVEDANRVASGQAVMFVETVEIAGLRGRAFTTGWYHWPLLLQMRTAVSPAAVLKIARDYGVRYFISPAPETIMLPAFAPFLTRFTEVVSRRGSFQLARLKDDVPENPPDEPVTSASAVVENPKSSAAMPLPAGDHDDDSPGIVYSGLWQRTQLPQVFGESIMFSNIPGAAAEFSFQGTTLTYVYTGAPDHGKAAIRIDGGNWEVLDQFAPEIHWQDRKTWQGLKPGVHRVEIRVLPERNPSSEGYYIDVDGILIR